MTMPSLPRALRPFGDPQYRFLVASLAFSLLASGVWIVAVVWQIIALGGGPSEVSLVATGSSVGLVLAVLFGGVVADRVAQRRILIVVESVRVLGAATAAALYFSDALEIWHLVLLAFVLGANEGFFFPAYSALLPRILPAEQLLAANGVEGTLRPLAYNAAGPAIAGAVIAVAVPAVAFAVAAGGYAIALVALLFLRSIPIERAPAADGHPLRSMLGELVEGFRYMLRTRWLLATLLFAIVLVFLIIGPIEVLLPFAVREQTGFDAGGYAIVLAAFGVGGATGSLAISSLRMPRRYLTVMILLWGLGSVPLAVVGLISELWLLAVVVFVVGATGGVAQVLWGTLLQQRVPSAMLGRVSSLDFFVSLALMPISMAVAGPVGEGIGIAPTFVVAGVLAGAAAVLTLLVARLGPDEIAHPLTGHDG